MKNVLFSISILALIASTSSYSMLSRKVVILIFRLDRHKRVILGGGLVTLIGIKVGLNMKKKLQLKRLNDESTKITEETKDKLATLKIKGLIISERI